MDESVQWTAIVPVKALGEAKSRLLPGDDPSRPELALAFAQDCATALRDAESVHRVLLVSDDDRVRRLAEGLGIDWIPEAPHAGLNAAASHGLAQVSAGPVTVVAGDLPCITGSAIERVLALADSTARAFVSDAAGTGTTMLLAHSARQCHPAFGERSRARHAADGCLDLGLDADAPTRSLLARARRDVDTAVDLADALRIGVGPATQRVLDWRTSP